MIKQKNQLISDNLK